MTPEEFAKMEDEKALLQCRKEMVEVLKDKEIMIAIATLVDVLIALVETNQIAKLHVYKNIIMLLLEVAKKNKEEKNG